MPMSKILGEERIKINNMAPRQRKTASVLAQFFVFFIVGVAGFFSEAERISITTIIILLIAAAVSVRLIILQRYIWQVDNSKFWVRCVIAAFAISALMGLAIGADEVDLGIIALGFVGLTLTTAHFIIWKIVAFFAYHTNPLPSSNPQQNHDAKDLSKEGKAYIKRFDALFKEIPNFKQPPISRQAKHIRDAYMQVHDFISKNPELKSGTHELMDYHFPQTLKLLETYGDFTKKKVKVDNINQILDNIIQSFDALSKAVDTQLNRLYAGKVLDIKTDMTVMKNMK
jgi:hypothetical protein